MKRLLLILLIITGCSKEEPIDLYVDCKPSIAEMDISKADPVTGLIEFDIVPDIQHKGAIMNPNNKLWDKGIVPYFIQGSVTVNGRRFLGIDREEHKQNIRDALKEMSAKTGILFPEYENRTELLKDHKNGVTIVAGFASASSYLGKQGHIQKLWLTFDFNPSVIQHEFLHALGVKHEFTRSDRDEYVIVNYENIPESAHRQFAKDPEAVDCGAFDLESIMMYGSFQVQLDTTKVEMTLLNGSTFERKEELSIGDITTIKTLYELEFNKR